MATWFNRPSILTFHVERRRQPRREGLPILAHPAHLRFPPTRGNGSIFLFSRYSGSRTARILLHALGGVRRPRHALPCSLLLAHRNSSGRLVHLSVRCFSASRTRSPAASCPRPRWRRRAPRAEPSPGPVRDRDGALSVC